MRKFNKDTTAVLIFLAPSVILLMLLILIPMLSNIRISFYQVPRNILIEDTFVGFSNYKSVLTDIEFYKSLLLTVLYTFFTVILSTSLGLAMAILFNRKFRFKKLVTSLLLASYVAPSISLVFAWKYMFNNTYGIVNYVFTDTLQIFESSPLWFDNPVYAFILVVVFSVWRYFPYAFISFMAILQTMDKSLYEAAKIDGANIWQQFRYVTLPAIAPVLIVVVTLRSIWTFYMYADVWLLTNQVQIIGVYLYKTAFSQNDLGSASAISIILFVILAIFIKIFKKGVSVNG